MEGVPIYWEGEGGGMCRSLSPLLEHNFIVLLFFFFLPGISFSPVLLLCVRLPLVLSCCCRLVAWWCGTDSNMYNRRVLAGEFTVVNKYLLR